MRILIEFCLYLQELLFSGGVGIMFSELIAMQMTTTMHYCPYDKIPTMMVV